MRPTIKPMKTINIWTKRLQTQIGDAIARSESHDQIVHIRIDGDSGDALAAISEVTDCETDYNISEFRGEDRMDIWGFEDDAKDGEMIWRLSVSFTNNI